MLPEPPAHTSRPATATARNTGVEAVCVSDFLSSLLSATLSPASAWALATLCAVIKLETRAGRVSTAISCQVFPPSSDRCELPAELMVQREFDGGAAREPEGATGGFARSTTSVLSAESCGSPTFRPWRASSGDRDPLWAAI